MKRPRSIPQLSVFLLHIFNIVGCAARPATQTLAPLRAAPSSDASTLSDASVSDGLVVTVPLRVLPPTSWQPLNGPPMQQLLNLHRAHTPSVAADNRTVAFLSDAPGVQQPFALTVGATAVAEAQWRRLVTIDDRVHFVRYAPRANVAVLGRDFGGDENLQLYRLDPTATAPNELTTDRRVKNMFGAFSDDGRTIAYASNDRAGGDFDIMLRPLNGSAPARRLYEAQGHNEAQDFSPNARQLLVTHERSNFDNDVMLVTVADGQARNITPHTGDERYQTPRFARDGRSVFLLTDRGKEFLNLAMLTVPAPATAAVNASVTPPPTPITFLTDEPHDVELFELSPNRRTAALVFNVDGRSELRLYDVSAAPRVRELARPRIEAGWMSSLTFAQDGQSVAFSLSRGSLSDEIYRLELRHNTLTKLSDSDHAGVDTARLVDATIERVRSFDQTEVPVLMYRPRGLPEQTRAPVVVMVHGGPESQAAMWFSPVVQFLVGHGYIVVEPNVRGSTGFGKRYAHMDDVSHREDSVRDLAEVNRWLRTQPNVDPDRIAVMGGSYGGYMTLAAITLYPELWVAACDIVGIANFRTFLERTAPYRRALREAEYGSLANDGALLDQISPIHRVDRIVAPLMVIHGANDPRVPVHEAEQIVTALRARGRTVEYVRFENEGHGVARRENRIQAYGQLVQFFDRIMLGQSTNPRP
jgi:dipeptidyl aminopeptidase/acylaminoacyl peptidase